MKVLFLSALLLASCASASTIEVQGHRGARGDRPENTLVAFKEALSAGVDTLELDIGVSKDGVLVVLHDPYVNPEICLSAGGKKLKGKIPVRSLMLKEIKGFDCGSLPNKRFPQQKLSKGEKIPTLQEVFDFVKAKKSVVKFNIETKVVPGKPELTPGYREFANKLVRVIKKNGLEDRVTVQSFDHDILRDIRKGSSKVKIAALVGHTRPNYVALAKDLKADVISPNFLWVTKEDIKSLHKIGVQVIPWTVNERSEWEMVIALGVDGIITDYPRNLISYLKKKKLR